MLTYTFRFVLALLATSLLPFVLSQSCYYPNGELVTQEPVAPCTNNSSGTTCCPLHWTCLSNNLCYLESEDLLGRYSCTDKNWKSNACANFCKTEFDSAGGNQAVRYCSDGWYCCNGNGSFDCCDQSISRFHLADATIVVVIATAGGHTSTSLATAIVGDPVSPNTTPHPVQWGTTSSTASTLPAQTTSSVVGLNHTNPLQPNPAGNGPQIGNDSTFHGSFSTRDRLALALGIPFGVVGGVVTLFVIHIMYSWITRRREAARDKPDENENNEPPTTRRMDRSLTKLKRLAAPLASWKNRPLPPVPAATPSLLNDSVDGSPSKLETAEDAQKMEDSTDTDCRISELPADPVVIDELCNVANKNQTTPQKNQQPQISSLPEETSSPTGLESSSSDVIPQSFTVLAARPRLNQNPQARDVSSMAVSPLSQSTFAARSSLVEDDCRILNPGTFYSLAVPPKDGPGAPSTGHARASSEQISPPRSRGLSPSQIFGPPEETDFVSQASTDASPLSDRIVAVMNNAPSLANRAPTPMPSRENSPARPADAASAPEVVQPEMKERTYIPYRAPRRIAEIQAQAEELKARQ